MLSTNNYVAQRARNSEPSSIAVKASQIIGPGFDLRNGGFGNKLCLVALFMICIRPVKQPVFDGRRY